MRPKLNFRTRAISLLLATTLVASSVPGAFAVEIGDMFRSSKSNATIADWKFGQDGIKSGSISGGDLILADQSGNNNDLRMNLYHDGSVTADTNAADWTQYLKFSDNSINGEGGSMVLNGNSESRTGADFITVDDAAINAETFDDGYSIEFLYYFPEDWTVADQWMGMMARQADPNSVTSMDEPELGSMSIAVSNCKEIQFLTAPKDDNHEMSSAAWSVSMDEGGVWYHIAITSDGEMIRTFVNGCESFRDYTSDQMTGLYADPNDGRFRIGSSWWLEGSQTLDKFLSGSLQQVRISNTALEQDEWLIPNPTDYVGDYGSNASYKLKNKDNYNFVLLPDTQNTVKFKPDVMETAIDELIETADELNVEGVIHLGDVVENKDSGTQMADAKRIFYKLPQSNMKLLMQAGNHDGWSSAQPNYWNTFTAHKNNWPSTTSSYLTMDSPSGWSSYMFVDAGSYRYLVISLSINDSSGTAWDSADEAWLKSVLEKYPNCPTIVTTHDIQNCSDTAPSAIKLSNRGQKLWDIVKNYDQVFLMAGGHSHGAGVEVLTNTNGQEVFSILTDYQFAYNGGNGIFRYLEFDETDNKLYYSAYSPYAASLSDKEKSFFDVNFLTGEGNEGSLDLNFSERFPDMKVKKPESTDQGKWMTGEYHTHTTQSNDASESFMKIENVLNAAFREDLDQMPDEARADNIQYGDAFDYLMLADHLRSSPRNPDGTNVNQYGITSMTRYQAIGELMRAIEELKTSGKYQDKIIYSGFEWDMPGLDHSSVAIFDETGEVPIDAIHAFEWLFADEKNNATSLYDNSGMDEQAIYGDRQATIADDKRNNVDVTYAALKWLQENFPSSFVLPNHPSRHNGGSGEVTIDVLRKMNDIAPEIVFGFEGMPGNQMDPYCELPEDDVRAGADSVIAVTGGVWDALLSEGRRFFNFANSDFHFKVSSNEQYSSGYWSSEYSRNYTWVEPGQDGIFTFEDVTEGMRSGNSYSVYGELVSDLDFSILSGNKSATMGEELNITEGDTVTVKIRFKMPENNNYESLYNNDTGLSATNIPELDHVDLISGSITGKVAESDYDKVESDARIVKTFTKEELGVPDADGYYTLTYQAPANTDCYYRLRGTSVSNVDENGDPVTDNTDRTVSTSDKPLRFDQINDYNYSRLSFYANPIFISTTEVSNPPSSGGGSGSSSNNTTTETIKNPDGSTTTIVTDKNTGTITQTIVYSDASKVVTETKKDGTMTTTESRVDGVSVLTITSSTADTTTTVKLPSNVDKTVVRVPISKPSTGTVAIIVYPDGREVVVRNTVMSNDSVFVPITDSATLKIVNRSKDFADVSSSHWASDAITFVNSRELFQGTTENNFSPLMTMSRSMMVTVLHRLENEPNASNIQFDDVVTDSWYADAVAWANETGVVTGTGTGFSPNGQITRETLAVMLYRYAKLKDLDITTGTISTFQDNADVSDWADEAIKWATHVGIITGKGNNKLDPSGVATRAEVAIMLERFVEHSVTQNLTIN